MKHKFEWNVSARLDAAARFFDVWRTVPRLALGFYMWQMWHVADWGMSRLDLSNAQTVFISTVYGAFPFLLNFYMQQGNAWMPPAPPANSSQPPPTPSGTVTATASLPGIAAITPLSKGN